jgi:hypothetical protein
MTTTTAKRTRYAIVDVSALKPFVYEDKWDEFLSVVSGLKPDDKVPIETIFKDIIECVADAFDRETENLYGKQPLWTDNDAATCAVFLIQMTGVKNVVIGQRIGVSEATINYRIRKFNNLYDKDHEFNRRVHIALHDLYERGYLALKMT